MTSHFIRSNRVCHLNGLSLSVPIIIELLTNYLYSCLWSMSTGNLTSKLTDLNSRSLWNGLRSTFCQFDLEVIVVVLCKENGSLFCNRCQFAQSCQNNLNKRLSSNCLHGVDTQGYRILKCESRTRSMGQRCG